jgi:hypothetical protein
MWHRVDLWVDIDVSERTCCCHLHGKNSVTTNKTRRCRTSEDQSLRRKISVVSKSTTFQFCKGNFRRTQCTPRGLRRRSEAARLLGLWVRIPPRAWMSVYLSVACCQVEVSAGGNVPSSRGNYIVHSIQRTASTMRVVELIHYILFLENRDLFHPSVLIVILGQF